MNKELKCKQCGSYEICGDIKCENICCSISIDELSVAFYGFHKKNTQSLQRVKEYLESKGIKVES